VLILTFRLADEQFSDERLKEHIQELSGACEKLKSLRGATYTWRKESRMQGSDERIIGFIAQEVAQVVPEAVEKTEEGFLSVTYASIIPLFVSALNEHLSDLEALKVSSEKALEQLHLLKSELLTLRSVADSSPKRIAVDKVKKQLSEALRFSSVPPMFPIWKLLILGGTFLTLIALAIGMGLLSSNVNCLPSPPAGSTPPTPVAFSPKNYLFNGGFEDTSTFPNATGWSGTYFLEFYNRSSSIDVPNLNSTTPFDFGNVFMALLGLSYARQEVSALADLSFSPFYALDASVWIYVVSAVDPRDISLTVEYFDTDQSFTGEVPYCSDMVNPASITPGWQLVKTSLACNSQIPPLRIAVSIVSNATAVACDAASVVKTPITSFVEPNPDSYDDVVPVQDGASAKPLLSISQF
jgi:hypothetical protein